MKQQPVDPTHETPAPVLLPPGPAGASREMLLDALINAALILLSREGQDVLQSADDGKQQKAA